jgi:predicted PurR-regulated permease PerM
MTVSDSAPGQSYLRIWVGLLASGLSLWLIITHAGLVLEVALVLFGAVLVSLAIRPLADVLARKRISRGVTALGVYLAAGGGLVLLASMLLPVIRSEVSLLQTDGPTLLQKIVSQVKATPFGSFIPSTTTLAASLSQHLDTLLTTFVGAVTGVGEVAIDLLIVLVLAYFFVTDAELGERLLSLWVPQRYQPRARLIAAHLRFRLTRWMWAQLAVALYFAVVFSIGLSVLGVPFGLTIGTVGGVLELVPYLGGTVGVLLAVLSALTVKPVLVLWVLLFHVVVVEVESHIVAPAFYGRIIGLHPAIILIALLVGAKTQGLLGVLFAVPAAVVLLAIVQELRTVQKADDANLSRPNTVEEG